MLFSPGNWQAARVVNAVGQQSGENNVVGQVFRPIFANLPGANWNDIADRLEDGGDEDIGIDIVKGSLKAAGRVIPQANMAADLTERLQRLNNLRKRKLGQ
jgi:hypothetical protein